MTKEYQVTPLYKLTIDSGHNWRVIKWTEERTLINGKYQGKTVEAGWLTLEKFWPHPDMALRYIFNELILGSDKEELATLDEFLREYTGLFNNLNVELRSNID